VLEHLTIVELTDERGYLAGKILADLGATVIKVEPPDGEAGRSRPPFALGSRDPEAGLPWLAMNTNKHSVVIDLESDSGRDRFLDFISRADVLLETLGPRRMRNLELNPATLSRVNAQLVHCAITPFGSDGPYSEYTGDDLVVVAMGGNASMTGDPTRAPLRCTLPCSYFHAGPEAVVGILTALYSGDTAGYVDVSMQECQLATTMSGPATRALGKGVRTRGGGRLGRTREIWATNDGWISFGLRGGPVRGKNLIAITDYMREANLLPGWLDAYDWLTYDHMSLSDAELARLEDAFAAFFRTKSMHELYEQSLTRRILLAPCNNAAEILEHEQLRSRSFFARVDYPDLGITIEHPARFASIASRSSDTVERAPHAGEHDRFYVGTVRKNGTGQHSERHEGSGTTKDEDIFLDVKILEFGVGAAGPVATRYFADRGATVIRVESSRRPDFLRHLHMTKGAPHGLNGAPMFISFNANKKSIAIDMTKPEGIALVRRLIAWADVVNENYSPGVMEKWGLDAKAIRELNPQAITVSSSLFGLTGPQRCYPGFGGQGSAIAGFNHLTGFPESEAHGPFGTITDSLSPRYTAALIASALLRRAYCESDGTDEEFGGESIDLSQIESGIYSLSELIVRYSATGEQIARNGNHHPWAAPHAIYPSSGGDRWIAISVFNDSEWQRLCGVAGDVDWAGDARFRDTAGRLEHEEELDLAIASWTQQHDRYELMHRLQQSGVQAGAVQTFEDVLTDPQLAHRRHFEKLKHRHLGPMFFERSGFRLDAQGGRIRTPGPDLGEHTDEILTGILGLAQSEIDELRKNEVLT
jgi:crotonobetainyl-CoA:carnitine CoA-transferase CaiB-like acyl-CoA transferase